MNYILPRLRTFIFCGALLASSTVFAIDLKGAQLGVVNEYSQIEKSLDFHFESGIVGGHLRCVASCGWGLTGIAGSNADVQITLSDDRQLLEIRAEFPPAGVDAIRAALIAKYGKPTDVLKVSATTGGGVTLPVVVDTWRISGDEIVLSNFVDAVHGMLVMTAKAEVERKAAVARKNASEI